VARIAEVLGLSTTDVLARHTRAGGGLLAVREDGACVFLGPSGCTVHAGRPGACRLYPLGRRRDPSGEERFAEVVPHPQSAGVYGGSGTVADWLRSQGAAPFIAAADRYYALFQRLLTSLRESSPLPTVQTQAEPALDRSPQPSDESLLDVDAIVARDCAERGVAVPADVDARVDLHLRALEAIADGLPGDPRA